MRKCSTLQIKILHTDLARRYNGRVTSNPQPPKGPVRRAEATGVVLIATIVLIITLVRYWHHIPWSAR